MRIFLASASFDEAYGGPAYSVSRLAAALAEKGAQTGIWAPDGSASRSGLSSQIDGFVRLDGSLKAALRTFGRPEVIHDSGLWRAHNIAISKHARQQGIPLVVSTRGMLEPWARRHKWLKKKLAWYVYQQRILEESSTLHATSQQEAQHIEDISLGVRTVYIPIGVDLPEPDHMAFSGKFKNRRKQAVFLGRLHPVKGLPMLIHAWSRVRPTGWSLVLAGPDVDGHADLLGKMISKLKLRDSVRIFGAVSGKEKSDLLANSSLFVLPSHSESFGMVVAEACAHGLPVLTTVAVPWPQLDRVRCGWRVAAEPDQLVAALELATSTPKTKLAEMGRRGHKLVSSEFCWDSVAISFLRLYEEIVGDRGNKGIHC